MVDKMDESGLAISICKGDHSHVGSTEVGVKITHKETGVTVYSLKESSQHKNKLMALELLKMELVKQRFANIDDDDLVDGKIFREQLNSKKYD
ncbi:MAG: protein subunit release factor A [Psychroserpens sp.]|jgi:protein subunit release factor A